MREISADAYGIWYPYVLHNNPQHNTAAEIVKVRKSTKSHVSSSLKNLESRGLIERIQSADNKKHIEIVLLDKADLIIEDGIKAQKEFAKIALDGLTGEEKRICKEVFHKICENADKYMRWDDEKEISCKEKDSFADRGYCMADRRI